RQIAGDGFGLAALFRAQSGIRPRSVHKSDQRSAEFLRDFHRAQSFAIAFRIGHAKVAVYLLLGVARFLVANDHDLFTVEAGHAADQRGVVSEAAISVDLTPVGKDALNV